MPVYDCRPNPVPGSLRFRMNVRVIDPATGERIPNVFLLDTAPARVGRFVTGPGGEPLAGPERKKRWVGDGRGGRRVEYYYDRLEVWEYRPWVATAADTGEVIAKSEGAP